MGEVSVHWIGKHSLEEMTTNYLLSRALVVVKTFNLLLATFRSKYGYDYEYKFFVWSTRNGSGG